MNPCQTKTVSLLSDCVTDNKGSNMRTLMAGARNSHTSWGILKRVSPLVINCERTRNTLRFGAIKTDYPLI